MINGVAIFQRRPRRADIQSIVRGGRIVCSRSHDKQKDAGMKVKVFQPHTNDTHSLSRSDCFSWSPIGSMAPRSTFVLFLARRNEGKRFD